MILGTAARLANEETFKTQNSEDRKELRETRRMSEGLRDGQSQERPLIPHLRRELSKPHDTHHAKPRTDNNRFGRMRWQAATKRADRIRTIAHIANDEATHAIPAIETTLDNAITKTIWHR